MSAELQCSAVQRSVMVMAWAGYTMAAVVLSTV